LEHDTDDKDDDKQGRIYDLPRGERTMPSTEREPMGRLGAAPAGFIQPLVADQGEKLPKAENLSIFIQKRNQKLTI